VDLDIHREITMGALPSGPWYQTHCCKNGRSVELSPREQIWQGNKDQDSIFTGQKHNEYHCDNSAFSAATKYMQEQWDIIRSADAAAAVRCCDCKHIIKAFRALGRILHCVQDFYAHSLWVESKAGNAGLTLWDYETDPNPPTTSGSWPLGKYKAPDGSYSHHDINKDNPDSKEGQVKIENGPNAGKALHKLAVEYALAATHMEFDKFRQRAPKIVACSERLGADPCAGCVSEHAVLAPGYGDETHKEGFASRVRFDLGMLKPGQALATAAAAFTQGDPVPDAPYACRARKIHCEL
jgi:hypothetical protein